MPTLRHILSAPRTLSVLDQGIVSGVNFVVLIYLGRKLDAAEYGYFSLAMIAVLFLVNLQRAVLTRPMNILGAAESREALLGRLLALFKLLAFAVPAAMIALAGFAWFYFPEPALFASCAAFLLCFFLQEMLRRYWYTINRIDLAATSSAICYGAQVLALTVLARQSAITASTALLVMAAACLCAFAWGAIAGVDWRGATARPSWPVATEHWPIAKWLVLTALAVWGASQVYPLLVAPLGPVAVATFAACANIIRGVNFFIQSVDNYLPTRAGALLHQQGLQGFTRHIIQTVAQGGIIGLLVALLLFVIADDLLRLAYGGTYDTGAGILRAMLPGALFALIATMLGAYSLALSDSRASFLANLGATACTFSVGFWLAREHGMFGAAIASSLTAATSMTIQGALLAVRLRALRLQAAPA